MVALKNIQQSLMKGEWWLRGRKIISWDIQVEQVDSWWCHQPSIMPEKCKDKCFSEKIVSSVGIRVFGVCAWHLGAETRVFTGLEKKQQSCTSIFPGRSRPKIWVKKYMHTPEVHIWIKHFPNLDLFPSSIHFAFVLSKNISNTSLSLHFHTHWLRALSRMI